jgi:hypothetical protein
MPDLKAPEPQPPVFDYSLPAELYVGRGTRRRGGLRFQSFETAAEAIRHVVETPHPAGEVSTIECDDLRLGMKQISELYNDARYPLPRLRTSTADEPKPVSEESEMKSIAIPVTRRLPAARATLARAAGSAFDAPNVTVGTPMPQAARHRFKIGDRLRMKQGGHSVARQAGACKVVFLLPFEGGQLLYRVKSEMESFERVVAEADLTLD